jgi:hypothetical protein
MEKAPCNGAFGSASPPAPIGLFVDLWLNATIPSHRIKSHLSVIHGTYVRDGA